MSAGTFSDTPYSPLVTGVTSASRHRRLLVKRSGNDLKTLSTKTAETAFSSEMKTANGHPSSARISAGEARKIQIPRIRRIAHDAAFGRARYGQSLGTKALTVTLCE